MARTGSYLLDTHSVIALFANETGVQQRLAEASEVFIPSMVVGELYYGAYKSARVEKTWRVSIPLSLAILFCRVTLPRHDSTGPSRTRYGRRAARSPKMISGSRW
jgi:predicted nucleic acid-binding protein